MTVIDFLIQHRRRNAWVVIISILLFASLAHRIRFENSIESFISPKDPGLIYYQQYKEEFGDDQLIALVIPMEDVFSKESLDRIDEISSRLEAVPQVRKVRSLTTTQDIVGGENSFEVLPFLEKIPEDPEELQSVKQSALNNPLYQLDLVSLDGKIASILIESGVDEGEDRYRKIMLAVHKIMKQSPFEVYYLAGDPLVELQMTQDMWKDLKIFVPVTYLVLFLLLWICFRNLGAVLVVLGSISLCLGFLFGLIGALDITMNAVTVGLPSLILCIAVLDSTHILSLYRQYLSRKVDNLGAIQKSIEKNLKPCFLTSITTCVGFASVCVSELVPIKQFGFLAACTTLAAYPICFLVMPYGMSFLASDSLKLRRPEMNKMTGFFNSLRPFYRYEKIMGAVILLIVALACLGMSRIRMETVLINFINEDSSIKKATRYIEENLGGISPLEISIEAPEEGGIQEPGVLYQIERFQEFLKALPSVDKTVSMVQFVKEMHQAMNGENPEYYFIPNSRNLIAQYIFTYSMSGRENDLDDFVDYTYKTARIRGRISNSKSEELVQTLQQIQSYIDANFESDLKVKVTSHSVIQADMMQTLIAGQIKGILTGFFFIFLIFWMSFRSVWVAILSLVPNTLPLLATGGLMGFAGFTLNAGSAMTACIAFGLVVDDTFHFLHHAKAALKRGKTPTLAVDAVFNTVGPAVLYSSILLAAGFLILMLGHSYFTFSFGLLCAFAILGALACDLFVTPLFVCHSKAFRQGLAG